MGRERRKLATVERFFAGTGTSYDFMVKVATFGIDARWKRIIVDFIPAHATRVLDLACGTGILTLAIARRYPHCRVVGVELRAEYLDIARAKAARQGIENVEFVLSRAEDYVTDTAFECVVSSYLAKYAELDLLTRNTRNLLQPQGTVLMHDFTFPPKPLLERLWRLYFKLLQGLGTPLFPSWRAIFYGLPVLIEESRWVTEFPAALRRYEFEDIALRYLTVYGSAIITARKRSADS